MPSARGCRVANGIVAVSRLREAGTVSALARLSREGSIPVVRRDEGIEAFLADVMTWELVEIVPEVTAVARSLLLRHALRAGDAIQLASALVLQSHLGERLGAFVSFDRRLLQAARAERLEVVG